MILKKEGRGWITLSPEGKSNFDLAGELFEKWGDRLGYDGSWMFEVKPAQTQRFYGQIRDFEMIPHRKAYFDLSTKLLNKEFDKLESTVIHECMHLVLYPYTRISERLERLAVKEDDQKEDDKRPLAEELHDREEEIVGTLERAFAALA